MLDVLWKWKWRLAGLALASVTVGDVAFCRVAGHGAGHAAALVVTVTFLGLWAWQDGMSEP